MRQENRLHSAISREMSWFLLILVCGFCASEISALKCVTGDGLQVDEVRKVIKTCMKKITAMDGPDNEETKNYDEYENFESDYESQVNDKDSERRPEGGGKSDGRRRSNDRMNNNYNAHNGYDYPQTGGNYFGVSRRNDRHDPSQYNPYQLTYGDNNNFNRQQPHLQQRRSFHYGQNKGNNDNSNATMGDVDRLERDRSCILQCFFQELKMTNDEGFPDRNRMTSVLTKQLRDRELRDFYIDSIQECIRMVSDDPKVHRDNCLHSKNLIICLSERAKMNCVDWNAETVIF